MKELFSKLYGWTEAVTVTEQGQVRTARAFIQPVSVTQPEYTGKPTVAGVADDRRYLLIAEPGAITQGGRGIEVQMGDRRFEVLRCEMLGGGSHWEGIMKLKGGAENA